MKVYPPLSPSNSAGESDKKKRKREVEETNSHVPNDTQHARFPNVFHANQHIASVHETLKKECEQLIELTVCFTYLFRAVCPILPSCRIK